MVHPKLWINFASTNDFQHFVLYDNEKYHELIKTDVLIEDD